MASTDVFETILTSLRSGDDAVREKGLQNFQDFVRSSLASSKSDDQESFWKEIINRILFPLTATSDTPQEKLVGIAAIDKLLLSPSDDAHPTSAPASQSLNPSASSTSSTRTLLYRLLRYLKNLLPDPNLVVMMAASQTYGAIFRIGGAIVAETVGEMEIQHAVGLMSEVEGEWTGSKNRDLTIARLSQSQPTPTPTTSAKPAPPRPPREKILAPHARMAGVLILIQIATYAPHIYHQHVALILSRIMYPLRDPSRFLVPVSANNANNDLFPGGGQAGNILDSLSGIAGTLATGSGDHKLGVEAQDIVRRLAARLFGVTLAVIEGREPGLLEQAALNEEQALASKPAPKKRDTIALSPSAARLERTGTLSTIHQQQPLSPITPSGSFRGPLRANEPLFNVATAASRDLLAYSSTELDHVDVRRLAPSAPSSQSKGDINRAFGALLIFRELLESGLTSLAGVSLNNPSKYPGDKKRLVMERRGDDAPRGLVGHLDGFQPPSASTSTISTGISKSNSLQSPPPPNYGSSGSPMAALERPMTYPRLFGVIFKLALSHPSPAGHTSLLAASTHSIANLLMAPSSPIAPSPSSSTFVGTPSSFTAAGNAISSGSGGIGTGVGWSTPLPAFSKSDTEDQLRKEALSLLPVCAAFDTETFKQGGFFRGTMYAILCAWGVESYSNSSSTQIGRPSGRNRHHHHHDEEGLGLFADEEGDEFVREEKRDTERMVSSMKGKIPVETKDRSYLVRVVGELTFAMRRSNAMLSYIWELGVIFNGALESRVQPPFPWRYDNYYSEAATAARESSATKANPANRGGPTGSKRASTAIEALSISTGKGAPTIGERTSSSSSIKSGPRRGLGGKNGKAIVITRGSVSDEVLFEAIALLCTALGVHALKVLGIAGWKEGEDHGDSLGGEKEVDESEDVHRQAAITKMFRFGLNPALCASLPHISHNIAVSLKMLQEHLLNEISTILSGHGYQAPGAPETEPRVVTTYEEKGGSPTTKKKATSSALIKLGLACLQTFDWHGRILTPLIQDGVLLYLDSKDRDVRMEASLSICKLFMLDPIAHHTSTASVGIINQVVGRLVRVALADADPEIRALVLSNLDESYDRHLAQVEHIRALCMALNDEDAAVRMQAVPIVGRLAVRNPANVMPGLRVELIKILTELEYSTDAKAILTTAEVLTSLLKCTERLIKPYAPSLLRVCLPKARSPLPYVSRRMVQCIGLLAEIAADDIIPSLEEIMDLLISILQDPTASANKKDMALVSLGQVCSNTSNVIDPYVKYPDILPIFRRMLRSESSDRTKRKVLQVMGILGAIDPYIRQTIPEPESADKTPAAKALQQSVKTVGSQPETFYQSVVIQSLLSILADPSLVSNHPNVIEVLLAIFKTQGMKCVPFLPQIIPAFSSMCRATNAKHQDYYLQQMSIIIQIVGSHIRNFMREVFQLVTDLWVNPILHLPIVGLVESLSTAMAAEFKPYLPVVIPQLLTVFNETSGYEQGPTVIRVFQAILSFGSAVEDFLHLILPVLLSTIESAAAPLHTRKAAANTIASLSQRVSLADNTSRIVQSLVRTLTKAEAPLQMAIMDMLCLLMVQVGPDFALFIPRITDCMTQNNIQYPQFHHLAEILMRGEPLPQKCGADERWSKSGHMDPVASADLTRPTVNQLQLRRSWSLDRVVRQEDWPRWFKSFSLGLMGESTSQALRACVSLAASHDPLAKELFNAAFYSCWVELSEPNKDDLVDVLSRALRDSRNTEIRLRLLGVIEFMEHEDKPLPIDNRTLGDIAAQTNALAKALHYKEHEFL
ncbi:phosphatidylinositol kinase- protein kinase tor1, partial [Serendipita sp. 400]